MSDLAKAVRRSAEGILLDVEVVPGSRESRFPAGFNAWRHRIEAKVKSRPEGGRANAELCRLVAEALGVSPSAVRVATGHTSRRKSLAVVGVDVDLALRRLAG